MNNNILISVVMPVYNAEKYLDEAIQSILTQTYNNFEFIIINDGSTDKSLEIIEKYKNQDKRIILISRENRGLIYSLNEGIEKANGTYIARMDGDDISLPKRFEEQIIFMEENSEIGVCGSWIEVFGKEINSTIWKIPTNNDELRVRLLFSVAFGHPTVMMRKEIIDNYKLRYNELYKDAEDYKFWIDFSKYTKFGNIPKILLRYRYVETSVSRVAENNKSNTRYKIISSIFREVLAELNVRNDEQHNKLHFTIALNERISKADIDLKILNNYLNKLIEANKITQVFDHKFLEQFLAKKLLIVIYYKIKKKDFSFICVFFFKLFWIAIIKIIKGRINWFFQQK